MSICSSAHFLCCVVALGILANAANVAAHPDALNRDDAMRRPIYSDSRIKSNVHTLSGTKMLEVIRDLRVVDFDYDHEQFYNKLFGKRNTGFIAQEVNEVFPRAVGVVKSRKLPRVGVVQTVFLLARLVGL
jgi:hypothetical protein